ncbi:VTT domain-containing protein [Shimia ponticola]|uniref:VTT domain-containing protein n=1 Tax=Shimia ponticola TaxID=2582893 RepID=UPI0011BEF9FB|nr:VTT domain-containing protein [Shimia ponticola]
MARVPYLVPASILFLAIILPFMAFGDAIELRLTTFFAQPQAHALVAMVVVLLLALDILLPLPSSLIAAAAGAYLGFWAGAGAVFAGLLMGSALGYWIGRVAGLPILRRTQGAHDLPRAGRGQVVALVATRAVPVLSEAMTITAGATEMRPQVFWAASTLANFGVAVTYAALGAFAATTNTFLWVFAASVGVPGVAWALYRLIRR